MSSQKTLGPFRNRTKHPEGNKIEVWGNYPEGLPNGMGQYIIKGRRVADVEQHDVFRIVVSRMSKSLWFRALSKAKLGIPPLGEWPKDKKVYCVKSRFAKVQR